VHWPSGTVDELLLTSLNKQDYYHDLPKITNDFGHVIIHC
jgi:hypothetical protein